MTRIVTLNSVEVENFRSFVKGIALDLNEEAGLTMVAGDNQVEPRLGANGSGKSSLFGAVCFCFYGVDPRGLRISDLVSWGQKKATVRVELDIDGESHVVIRTGPPSRLTLDGDPVEQHQLDELLGLNLVQFKNSVLFGQAVPLFIDLPVSQRGELLDEALDLERWTQASDLARKRASTKQTELQRLQNDVSHTLGKISALESLEDIEAREAAWRGNQDDQIAALVKQFDERQLRLETARKELQTFLDTPIVVVEQAPKLESLNSELSDSRGMESDLGRRISAVETEMRLITKTRTFLADTGDCPACGQEIDPAYAAQHLEKHDSDLAALADRLGKLNRRLEHAKKGTLTVQKGIDEAREKQRALDRVANERDLMKREKHRDVVVYEESLQDAQAQLARARELKNPYIESLIKTKAETAELSDKLRIQRRQEETLKGGITALESWQHHFKRVRLFCIERVLRQLDIETMNAALSLGLIGWKISYTTESETKSGSVKLGVQVAIKSPHMEGPFNAWSGGEGQRVRLCTALGFAGLLQRWAGVRWRLECFDEPTNWLSSAGIEDLLDLLRDRAESHDKRIFIMDHRGLMHAGFSQVLTVVKDEHGSRIE